MFSRQFARALLLSGDRLRELRQYCARVSVLVAMFCLAPALVRERLDDIL